MVSRVDRRKILLKDLVVRLIVGLEGGHTIGLSDEEVKEVLDEILAEDPDDDVESLLESLYRFHIAVNNW